nr:zinc finger, CCHC-type [Tanacetum cinerariifolium]
MKNLSELLEITPGLATRAIETTLSSPIGTMWCMCDPTPSDCDLWLQVQIFYDHVNPAIRRTIDQSAGVEESEDKKGRKGRPEYIDNNQPSPPNPSISKSNGQEGCTALRGHGAEPLAEEMAEEDEFLVNDVKGGLCVDNTDAGIDGRFNSGSNKDKGIVGDDDYICRWHILNEDSSSKKFLYNDKLPPSWKDFKHTLKHGKDDLSLVQLGSQLRIEESLRVHKSDKDKCKEVARAFVNVTEEGKIRTTNKTKERNVISIHTIVVWVPTRNLIWNVGSMVRLVTSSGIFVVVDAIARSIDSGATTHVCKDRYSVYMSYSTVANSSLWHAHLEHVHYKRMLEMSKDELIPAIDENPDKCTTCNKKYVINFIDDASRFCYVYLLHAKDEALDKFRIYKTEVEFQQNDLVKTLRIDRGGEYYDPVFFQSIGIIHETTSPYTPQQNGVTERKNRALKKMVNSMLSYSGLKSRDVIFDENHFFSIPRPKDIILNLDESQRDDNFDDVPSEIPEPRKGNRVWKAKSYGSDF